MNNFSRNIRYLRKKYDMSQDELAKKLGYKSFTTIQKWESDDSEPTLSTLNKIAKIFNINLSTLVEGDLEKEDVVFTMPETIHTAEEAVQFLFEQKIIAANTGINIDDMSDDDKVQFANRLLDYARWLDDDRKNRNK